MLSVPAPRSLGKKIHQGRICRAGRVVFVGGKAFLVCFPTYGTAERRNRRTEETRMDADTARTNADLQGEWGLAFISNTLEPIESSLAAIHSNPLRWRLSTQVPAVLVLSAFVRAVPASVRASSVP